MYQNIQRVQFFGRHELDLIGMSMEQIKRRYVVDRESLRVVRH